MIMSNEQLKQTIIDKLAAFPNSPQINDVVEIVKQIGCETQPAHVSTATEIERGTLPCPWCGCAEVKIITSEICCPIQYSATAVCAGCNAEEPNGSGVYDSKDDAEREALLAWSDRSSSPAPEVD